MKTTRSSDIIPTIEVVVSYVRYKKTVSIDWDKWPNISINHNTDYYIIEEGNSFGLSNYDHIALNSQNIKENDVVF